MRGTRGSASDPHRVSTPTPSALRSQLQPGRDAHLAYLTGYRTSCARASGPAGRGSRSSWCSSSSRKWPPSCSWHTTASSWSRPRLAASPAPAASSPRRSAGPAPAPSSAASPPWSALPEEGKTLASSPVPGPRRGVVQTTSDVKLRWGMPQLCNPAAPQAPTSSSVKRAYDRTAKLAVTVGGSTVPQWFWGCLPIHPQTRAPKLPLNFIVRPVLSTL